MRKYKDSKKYISFVSRVEEDKDKFINAISTSVHRACKQFGVSEAMVKRYADANNIPYQKKYIQLRDVDIELQKHIVDIFENTFHTKRDIMEAFGINSKVLNKILANFNATKSSFNELDEEFVEYTKLVRRLTTVVKNHHGLLNVDGKHWDHIISVKDGFEQNIPATLLAARENLELVESKDNLSKGAKSNMDIKEFYTKLNLVQGPLRKQFEEMRKQFDELTKASEDLRKLKCEFPKMGIVGERAHELILQSYTVDQSSTVEELVNINKLQSYRIAELEAELSQLKDPNKDLKLN